MATIAGQSEDRALTDEVRGRFVLVKVRGADVGGAVKSDAWTTGAASPAGPVSVSASYSITVGSHLAQVQYLGLTPGFVGLFQANFKVPSVASGTYPIVVTVAGNPSPPATIVVGE